VEGHTAAAILLMTLPIVTDLRWVVSGIGVREREAVEFEEDG